MTMQPAGIQDEMTRSERMLFTPGPRLGWVFRDRRRLVSPYAEPEPDPQTAAGQIAVQRERTERAWRFSLLWVARPLLPLAAILYAVGELTWHRAHPGTLTEQAAAFIGRHHTFTVSGWTATRGGEHSTTWTSGYSHGTSQSHATSTNSGWSSDGLRRESASGGHTRSRDHGQSQERSQSDAASDGTNATADLAVASDLAITTSAARPGDRPELTARRWQPASQLWCGSGRPQPND
jgi:hypothetical protein